VIDTYQITFGDTWRWWWVVTVTEAGEPVTFVGTGE